MTFPKTKQDKLVKPEGFSSPNCTGSKCTNHRRCVGSRTLLRSEVTQLPVLEHTNRPVLERTKLLVLYQPSL